MKINRYTLAVLFLVVFSSLGVLLFMQFQIVERDIQTNKAVMETAIAGILSDLYDMMMFNDELRRLTSAVNDTKDFQFTNHSDLTDPLQLHLKSHLDEVISLNYPDLDYKIDGFVSTEYGCMIHRGHRPELPKAKVVINADNHMCFCMILPSTLDISMTYLNEEEALIGDSAGILRTSFLLIFVIIASFWYTIHTIRKQKKLSDLKRDFINNLTHEFKTPIFSISLAAKSIMEQDKVKESDKLNSYANLISSESKRLQTQVDKILQMALMDSGNLTLEKKTLDLHECIRNVAEGFTMIIEEKQGNLVMNLNATKTTIIADETHLNNVLFNLIDNGQKYTDGSPTIEILTEDTKEGIQLTIRDHGIGMDQTTQKYIFDQFYRSQAGDVHNVKGFGLGLSYVKKIVEFHEGSIHLKSAPGQGSEFSIQLPIA